MNTLTTMPDKNEMQVIRECAQMAKETGHYRKLMASGGEGAILLLLLTARELGLPPMAALNGGLQIVDGRVEMSAHMKTMKIRQAGHHLSISYNETGDTCTIVGKRIDNNDDAKVSYSLKDATKAGLSSRPNWQKHPKEMLYARCLSRIANILFPDAIGGVTYAKGEIGTGDIEEADIDKIDTSLIENNDFTGVTDVTDVTQPEVTEDVLDTMLKKLYSLFPGQDDLFAKFVVEKAEAARMSLDKMYESLYKNINLVPSRFESWLNEQQQAINE